MPKKILTILLFVLWAVPAFAEKVDDILCVRTFNGPGNGVDEATAIAVDNSGNVYVTGYIDGGQAEDYGTIKYYPSGDTAWLRRYNGSGNGNDKADAIAVDNSGNVYVTGYSTDTLTGDDYTTIKYYPNGDTAWVRRYNYYGNFNDDGHAIAVDNSGNVYVTGRSSDSTGAGLWDYATIKYYPNGDTAWVRRYSKASTRDIAYAITVDDSGNVYVTGSSGTVKYDSNGTQLWDGNWGGIDVGLDSSNNVYVTGGDGDYITVKYYPAGGIAWVRTYNGPLGSSDVAKALAVDNSGNVYVTGYVDGITAGDYGTIKYYPNGDTAWVRRYNGPANGNDVANALAVDNSGNIYVTGKSYGSGTYYDYATIKYYPSGGTAWVKRYSRGNDVDKANAIAVDGSHNVYVTGVSAGDYATMIKYLPDTTFLRGDITGDGVINIGDVNYLINYLYSGGPPPNPLWLGDVNCDCVVAFGDMVYLINYLYKNGPPPC